MQYDLGALLVLSVFCALSFARVPLFGEGAKRYIIKSKTRRRG